MKDDIILKVENLSKQYRLGTVGTGTISHDFNRFLARIRGKEDPYLKIGESNDRASKSESEYVWALKDINFEVKRGEVLGIIGKNGAGKSTLLKILSKVTGPTTGTIKSNGRIASLLEVGTGFHPEMTGKENIFLNGAILGMTKKEIQAKLDEIVSFSGCERYIDTPVKRYSSGMKVRLAFAVAAHLEPDILVVDEVLAVGDAEFQKKAIGKMQDISNTDGRTVLFVSHDMGAIRSLCTKTIMLDDGLVYAKGQTDEIISEYLNKSISSQSAVLENSKYIEWIKVYNQESDNIPIINIGDELILRIKFTKKINIYGSIDYCFIGFENEDQRRVLSIATHMDRSFNGIFDSEKILECKIMNLNLIQGRYKLMLAIGSKNENIEINRDLIFIDIHDNNFYDNGFKINKNQGFILEKPKWRNIEVK
ncbi:ABC transporter ATP-binding protein [uncultured Polaribacter sp.]|uniref:ABC transporter ATP-binding protein n=1 Tax=uncultured Polaribacter sp. TaxID=174711 RepID=UPI0026343863|nr:ABC transporter ATP-binding protein [uncultured Polaribacter sp.]